MNWYPQIGGGAMAQFPLERRRQWRSISNVMESGELVTLPDSAGGRILWRLSYQDLTDTELARLTSLHSLCRGNTASFGFVDPFANLFGWSEDLTKPDWQTTGLTLTAGQSDPVGTQRAWIVSNGASGELALTQSIGVPGQYVVCFSAYVRSDTLISIGMSRDAQRTDIPVSPQWKRIYLSGSGSSAATSSAFSMTLPAGANVRIFGPQLEAQPWPSPYRPTGAAMGILTETRFSSGGFTVASTEPGLSSCQVGLVSRVSA